MNHNGSSSRTPADAMWRDADISSCGTYRYSLIRRWDDAPSSLMFIMLNPSTADAFIDDPTIRRCIGFAKRNGFGGIGVVNLYALRATNPSDLWAATACRRGPENERVINRMAIEQKNANAPIVCAWGAETRAEPQFLIARLQTLGTRLVCLGVTKDGHPGTRFTCAGISRFSHLPMTVAAMKKSKSRKQYEVYVRAAIRRAAANMGATGVPTLSTEMATTFLCKHFGIVAKPKNPRKLEALVFRCVTSLIGHRKFGSTSQCEDPHPPIKTKPEADLFYASWEWKKARYETLKQHGPRCQCCGAGRDTAMIVVDHIKPLRKYWDLRLDQKNLQVLCDPCNKGKSNEDETDWR